MVSPLGTLSNLSDQEKKIFAILPKKDKIKLFPYHKINSISQIRKFSHLPGNNISDYKDKVLSLPDSCFTIANSISTSNNLANGKFFRLEDKKASSITNSLPIGSIVVFDSSKKNIIKKTFSSNSNIFFLEAKYYEKYKEFFRDFDSITSWLLSKKLQGVQKNYIKQYILFHQPQNEKYKKYLAPSTFFHSSLIIRLLVDSVGKSKELGNFFIPITYEAIYCIVEIPIFQRSIINTSNTLLSSSILNELYRNYFLIKLGITMDIFGIAWAIDFKGLSDIILKINSTSDKMKIIFALLTAIFRAISFTIREEYMMFYLTFDFYSNSFSISSLFFPIKYSAYIDRHGKKDGVEIRPQEGIQITYY